MTQADAKLISSFIARTGMWVYPVDEHGIVSFITGFEAGSHGRCQFTKLLAAELAKKHRVKLDCQGWPSQVRRFGKRRGVKWTEAFMLSASLILTKSLDAHVHSTKKGSI
jgi:hypothetical protein